MSRWYQFSEVEHLRRQGRLREALRVANAECDLARDKYGAEHPHYARTLNDLATLQAELGDYDLVETLYQRALQILRQSGQEAKLELIDTLNNLAVFREEMGDYAAAERFHQEALQKRREIHRGDFHGDVAQSLNNLANLYRHMGNLADARKLLEQALKIKRALPGPANQSLAVGINNLGDLYRELGYFAEAKSLYEESIEIKRKCLGEKHPSLATSLNNYATLLSQLGDARTSEKMYRAAIAVVSDSVGATHPEAAETWNNLGGLYGKTGRLEDAERCCRLAHEIILQALGDKHPRLAVVCNNLANLYHHQGDLATAERWYRQALQVHRDALGPKHYRIADTLNNLAILCAASHRYDEALELSTQAADIQGQLIGQIFSVSSDRERLTYLAMMMPNYYGFLSLVVHHLSASEQATNAAYRLVLRRKALAAEASVIQRNNVLRGRFAGLKASIDQLTSLRIRIGQKTLAGPGKEGREVHERLLAQWHAEREQLELELARQIPEMSLDRKLRTVDHSAVAKALPQGYALVEFVHFYTFDFRTLAKSAGCYVAFVIRTGPESVRMVKLGESAPIRNVSTILRHLQLEISVAR